MSRSAIFTPWALGLWGLLLLLLFIGLVPWQTGRLLEQTLPNKLGEFARSLQVQAVFEDYARGWLQTQVRLALSHPALREPIPLTIILRHGPWLGEGGWGWVSARMPWPQEGGLSPFPAHERLELRLKTDLWGRTRACVWRMPPGGAEEKLGEFIIERQARRVLGETRLPGLMLAMRAGELRVAEMDVRLRLTYQAGRLSGMLGLDARRAALARGARAWLIEQPWLDLTLGPKAQLQLRLAGVQGATPLGKLHVNLHWQGVEWMALGASLEQSDLRLGDPSRLRRQLDRLGLALGEGEIVLERLRLEHPVGRLELDGALRGRPAAHGLRRLDLDLRLAIERPLAVNLLQVSRWVPDIAGAERLLAVLLEQQILVEDEAWLRGALTLWDGTLTLSGRPMLLDTVLSTPLNSRGVDERSMPDHP